MRSTNHRITFEECVQTINNALEKILENYPDGLNELSKFDIPIYLKNRERVVVFSNNAHRSQFSTDRRTLGLAGESFLDTTIVDVSKYSDLLLLAGADHIQFDHVGRADDGQFYNIKTYKRNLLPLAIRGLAILGISQFQAAANRAELGTRLLWSEQVRIFNQLDARDREICRQICLGTTTREIAAQLQITSRSVEAHKQKILDSMTLSGTVELIKLMVRFQEHGIADLGI